jgi:predicted metal-dependent hydrolase
MRSLPMSSLLKGPTYPFKLTERISTQARAVRIEVRPDGEVRLVIPKRVSRRDAHAFVRERQDWISGKLQELQQRRATSPKINDLQWDGTDTLSLHGVPVPLRVVDTSLGRPQVRIGDAIVLFRASGTAPAQLHRALVQALRALARTESTRLLDEEAARLQLRYSGPRIGDATSRWGSCTPDGLISLSWRLILAPPAVFRYVVIHELCHIAHLDHSPRFWGLVEQQMPDYREHRTWLRRHGADLHQIVPRGNSGGADDVPDEMS